MLVQEVVHLQLVHPRPALVELLLLLRHQQKRKRRRRRRNQMRIWYVFALVCLYFSMPVQC
jgi:hypothetical protein